MAQVDLQTFIEELLIRFDPELDLAEGSRAQTEFVEPLMTRIGTDPFDLDLAVFVRERVRQAFPDISIGTTDAFTDLFIDPLRVVLEPIVREIQLVKLRQSLKNVESLGDAEVDALLANFFKTRRGGGYAQGVVRVFFSSPVSQTATIGNPASTRSGLRYFPTTPQQITAEQMLLNISGSEYYWDINYTAERQGDEYNVEPGEVVAVSNMPSTTRITNLRKFRDGTPRETSLEFQARVEGAIGNETLSTAPGIAAVLPENFPELQALKVIGFRDPEMQRDIIRGGGVGAVLEDTWGTAEGEADLIDDADGDLYTGVIEAADGHFVSRIASAGLVPDTTIWWLTLVYQNPDLGRVVVRDYRVLEVLSETQVVIDAEIPLPVGDPVVYWALRHQVLTISDIPGGIELPEASGGDLEIEDGVVHLGGRTDIYVGGPSTDSSSTQLQGLQDETPLARGYRASTTAGSPWVQLLEYPVPGVGETEPPGIETLMSLSLDEGTDIGSYLIQSIDRISGPNLLLKLEVAMSGTQSDLSWKIVDDIDVDLIAPKDLKVEGEDLVVVAFSPVVTTTAGTNFVDLGVGVGHLLEIMGDPDLEAVYEITAMTATTLTLAPIPSAATGAGSYRVYRPSDGLDTPVVRVSDVELIDSAGAPNGTRVPHRDPLAVISQGFQNEGNTLAYQGIVKTGLVSSVIPAGGTAVPVGGLTLWFNVFDPEAIFLGPTTTEVFTFPAAPASPTAQEIVDALNASAGLETLGIRATLLEWANAQYVGIVSQKLIVMGFVGTANPGLGFSQVERLESTNARILSVDTSSSLFDAGVEASDAIEVQDGNARGTYRVIRGPINRRFASIDGAPIGFDEADSVLVGWGPLGPQGLMYPLYGLQALRPSVGAAVSIHRPAVGSARFYFSDPTSFELTPESEITAEYSGQSLGFRPNPDSRRGVQPAPPLTALPGDATTLDDVEDSLENSNVDFLAQGIRPGDILEVLFYTYVGNEILPASPTTLALTGLQLKISVDRRAYVTITFPGPMTRDEVVEFLNAQLGATIFDLGGPGPLLGLSIAADYQVDILNTEFEPLTAVVVLGLVPGPTGISNRHPDFGEYVISEVATNTLMLSPYTQYSSGFSTAGDLTTRYRIWRYTQRLSSTEMNLQQDETGLYYSDMELLAEGPGNQYNIPADIQMVSAGHLGDGWRLSTTNPVLSFSRAELLRMECSRSMLLVGSSDSPTEYIQLLQKNIQINYERSALVDDIQSFCDSDFNRDVNEDILVRHLLPHYVYLNLMYVGGQPEVTMRRALETYLGTKDPEDDLEVQELLKIMQAQGAQKFWTPSTTAPNNRVPPLFVVVYHTPERQIRGLVVRDRASTGRVQRFIPGNLGLTRVAATSTR